MNIRFGKVLLGKNLISGSVFCIDVLESETRALLIYSCTRLVVKLVAKQQACLLQNNTMQYNTLQDRNGD